MFRTALHICEGSTTGELAAVERIDPQMGEELGPWRGGGGGGTLRAKNL